MFIHSENIKEQISAYFSALCKRNPDQWGLIIIDRFQDLFDQILKVYAEKLQKAYDNEEDFKKKQTNKNGKDNFKKDSLSRKEIDIVLTEKKSYEDAKKIAEKEFWELHDFLMDFGFEVWDSYKHYITLKPLENF